MSSYHTTECQNLVPPECTHAIFNLSIQKEKKKENEVKISDAFEGGLYIFKSGCLPWFRTH